jgi:hypothetical protein
MGWIAMKIWIIAGALGIALSAGSSSAFAQAGSTGGTAVKQDKSVSGGEEAPPHVNHPPHRPPTEKSLAASCQSVVGTWDWFFGPSVTFKEDGTGGNGIFTFTWTCSNGRYVLTWNMGSVDRLKLSADNKGLDGSNQNGTHVFASRK